MAEPAAGPPTNEKLSPCPFCGGELRHLRLRKAPRLGEKTKPNEPEGWDFFVYCVGCGAQGGHSKGPGFPEDDPEGKMGPGGARRLWNMRTPRLRAYRCNDPLGCGRTFLVPHDAPWHMDPQRDGTFPTFLSCPWCDGHAQPLEELEPSTEGGTS